MIVELYGLPGAGKTTFIKKITGGSATTISGESGLKKNFIQLAKRMALYFPSSLYYKRKMMKILYKYKKNIPKYTCTSLEHHMNNIVLVVFGYDRMHGDIYMDEGLIHRILTMAVNYRILDNDVLELLNLFSNELSKVECAFLQVPISICFESIRKRNRHECEMDEFDDNTLCEYLRDFEHYCHLVCKEYDHRIVYRSNTIN